MTMPENIELKVVLDTSDALDQMAEIIGQVDDLNGRLLRLNLAYIDLMKTLGDFSVQIEEREDGDEKGRQIKKTY